MLQTGPGTRGGLEHLALLGASTAVGSASCGGRASSVPLGAAGSAAEIECSAIQSQEVGHNLPPQNRKSVYSASF